ncbi:MAG: TetR/AcrR family transcriptional regulator [Pyrinomonadaceae bacterium]
MSATAKRKRETREAILDATDKLLAQYGYSKMTIDDIAAAAGIGKGSVYLHFPSKVEIALSHVDRIIERLCERLIAIRDSGKEPETKIREMLFERVSFRFSSVQHYTEGINELLSSIRADLLERRRRHHAEEARLFASVIEEGIEKGVFAKADAMETAMSLIVATNSLLPFGLSTAELGLRKEIEDRAKALSDLLLSGLRA